MLRKDMVISEDRTQAFIPKKPPKVVILGTMVAICARTLDGVAPTEETFYYHNPRNHFWRVLQHLLQPGKEIRKMSVSEKRDFLEKHQVAIVNLVQKIEVPNAEAYDPSDTILFKAYKKNRIDFRNVKPKVRAMLRTVPKFFTCRSKKGIENLIEGFAETNKLGQDFFDSICYLPTPTRCNPKDRSDIWRKEIGEFCYQKKLKNPL